MDLAIRLLFLLLCLSGGSFAETEGVTREEALELREEVRSMFYHAYNNYMEHAFPLDELLPLSCGGENSLGGYSLSLIDAMDTLALFGDAKEFSKAVKWVSGHVTFDKNQTVSVFETNIRVMGGLLSAHLLASDPSTGMAVDGYTGKLLELAQDLGRRFLPAFYTPTGIPFGSVNLQTGIFPGETTVTSTAGGGTLALEFGLLSRLTGDPVFEDLALNSLRGLWSRRSPLGLVGAHIDVFSGEWTHRDSGIGTSIDSFYEYLLKAHLLLGGDEYLHMFNEAYQAVLRHLHQPPWYLEVNMDDGMVVWPLFNSLQAFWPGLQVLAGDVEAGAQTHAAFYGVWRRFGFTPEGFNLVTQDVQAGQQSYPLRPELAESTYWLYRATRDPMYLHVGRDIIASIQYGAKCPCGYCHIKDVQTHEKEDHMESFFLSETVKYLWLLFDSALDGDNLVENGPYPYVFSTEGHLFPIRPDLSLEKNTPSESRFAAPVSQNSVGSDEIAPERNEPLLPKSTPAARDSNRKLSQQVDDKEAEKGRLRNGEQKLGLGEGTCDMCGSFNGDSASNEQETLEQTVGVSKDETVELFASEVTKASSEEERGPSSLMEIEVGSASDVTQKRFRLSDGKVSLIQGEGESPEKGSSRGAEELGREVDGTPQIGAALKGASKSNEGNFGSGESLVPSVDAAPKLDIQDDDSPTITGVSHVANPATKPAKTVPPSESGPEGRASLDADVNVRSPDVTQSCEGTEVEVSGLADVSGENGAALGAAGEPEGATCPPRDAESHNSDVSSSEGYAAGAVGGVSVNDDVSKNGTIAGGGEEADWDVWTEVGAQPLVGRCGALSFWRTVGVHNLVPFPPSADQVTNHEHIQARQRQRQMQQMQMATFFQQAAQSSHVAKLPPGQKYMVTVNQQGRLLFQQLGTPAKRAKTPPVKTSTAPALSEVLATQPPICKTESNNGA